MVNTVLFVFEGEKTEQVVFEHLNKHFLKEIKHTTILTVFKAEIYQLYKVIKNAAYIDIIEHIRLKNTEALKDVGRDDVSEIYLFFDYDGHSPIASDEELLEMLEYFNNETENGKLYLSYPMVEAIRHLKSTVDFQNITVQAKVKIGYKEYVEKNSDDDYKHLKKYEFSHWKDIIQAHCNKLNFIVNDTFSFPSKSFEQKDIFNCQLEKYIKKTSTVAVLSAFPVLLLDYYGVVKLCTMLELVGGG